MDYSKFVKHHRETNADITLSVVPINEKRASAFGLMKIDDHGRIIDFSEKPEGDALKDMQVDTSILGLNPEEAKKSPYIASMGIYVFKKEVLQKLLKANTKQTDFGKEIIPAAAKDHKVQAYLYNGYWEDIGTIEAFYDANLALTNQPKPEFSFYDEKAPIYTRSRYLPPSKIVDSVITDSMISEGCILKKCRISNCVLGVRSRVESDCIIEDSLVMGSDFYEMAEEREAKINKGSLPLGIGSGSTIRRAIIDKNARIGSNVKIVNKDGIDEANHEDEGFLIRNGIVVIIKNAVIKDNTVI
jgi:glucose-1-phosphate adenylyltransferase